MALHDRLAIGPYSLECVGFTQDSNLNYNSEYALLDVYEHGKKLFRNLLLRLEFNLLGRRLGAAVQGGAAEPSPSGRPPTSRRAGCACRSRSC